MKLLMEINVVTLHKVVETMRSVIKAKGGLLQKANAYVYFVHVRVRRAVYVYFVHLRVRRAVYVYFVLLSDRFTEPFCAGLIPFKANKRSVSDGTFSFRTTRHITITTA